MTPDLQRLVRELQVALETHVQCGQIVLNLNEGAVQSVEVTTKRRIVARRREDFPAAGDERRLTVCAVVAHS